MRDRTYRFHWTDGAHTDKSGINLNDALAKLGKDADEVATTLSFIEPIEQMNEESRCPDSGSG